jgi:hypothetical protein
MWEEGKGREGKGREGKGKHTVSLSLCRLFIRIVSIERFRFFKS